MDNSSSTKGNKYKPTAAQQRILDVSLNPENLGKNVSERIKLANVARKTWYAAMNNTEFIKLLNEASISALKSKVNDVINATFKYAVGDSKCAQDRKTLLTMMDLYSDKHDHKVESTVAITSSDLQKELEKEGGE